MKKKGKPVDPSKLPSMSATLLAFAKPLLDQLPEPPTAKGLQGVLNIASVVWNLRVYDQAQHPNAAALRAGLDAALASMPPEGKATLAVLSRARLITHGDDPRLAFAEVVIDPHGKAEVQATAFLLPGPRGADGWARRRTREPR